MNEAPLARPFMLLPGGNDQPSLFNVDPYALPWCEASVSKDPIGPAGGINVYQYAPNPIRWTDPLGLTCQCDCEIDLPFERYPQTAQHILDAQAKGCPSTLTWEPTKAAQRRRQQRMAMRA